MNYVPYGRQTISEDDISAVVEVLRGSYLTQGPVVPAFENEVCKKVGARYGVGVNSATSALHVACLALGLGPGDWLWTSPITFVASANCGLYCGALVDFVDIDDRTGLMSISALEKRLEEAKKSGRLPKVVIPVHHTGECCEMEELSRLSKRYGFSVIEDASHAIGAKYKEEAVGSCRYSDITVFSFHPVKIITSGEGGMAVTNSKSLAEKMARLRSHGIEKDQSRFLRPPQGGWAYEQQDLGFNYRLTDIQGALGLSQLKKLDVFVDRRKRIAERYRELLARTEFSLLDSIEGCKSSHHLFVLKVNSEGKDERRQLFNHLRAKGIGVQVHYTPVHLQPYYRAMGFSVGDFPNAEDYGTRALSLPIYPELTRNEQDMIVLMLKEWLDD